MALTHTDLLHGALYAIQQAGFLLHDAVALYKRGRYSSAVVLAVFCREELGRTQIFLEARESSLASAPVSADFVRKQCDDHVEKLRRGQTGTVMRWGPEYRERLEGLFKNPQTEEYRKARALADEMVKRKAKREPQDVHERRLSALYVEPNEAGHWNRPSETSKEEAQELVGDVANDYAMRRDQLRTRDEKLAAAIAEWRECPELPPPIWPWH